VQAADVRFFFAYKEILRPPVRVVKRRGNPASSLVFNAVAAAMPAAENIFGIIERVFLAWRYRLGVRTEDSQSSNPGSIPGSATNSLKTIF
jgi:hypothetical protein